MNYDRALLDQSAELLGLEGEIHKRAEEAHDLGHAEAREDIEGLRSKLRNAVAELDREGLTTYDNVRQLVSAADADVNL